jgi:DNA repair protein RecO (recombination protein O)
MELLSQVYLLHARPYRDNSLLVTLFCREQGKIAAVAYSGNSAKSNNKGLLQPFIPLSLTLKGKGSLKNASMVTALNKGYKLSGDYLYSGFYLNELLMRLLPESLPCSTLFDSYHLCLQNFDRQLPLEASLRIFEVKLLDELGSGIDFSPLFSTPADEFVYIPESGFLPAQQAPATMLRYSSAALKELAKGEFSSEHSLKTAKYLLRQLIAYYLGGKPLNSRKFFVKKEK